MEVQNLVVFKGTIDGITVLLNKDQPFEHVLQAFKEKLETHKKFFEGTQINIRFRGRSLSKEQQEDLLTLLTQQKSVEIGFVHTLEQTDEARRSESEEWLLEELEKPQIGLAYFHYGIVRSGQHIHYPGSIIVIGDVNPGAQITAEGHIIVIGTLNGKVHAGFKNTTKKSFVIAMNMYPTQITIQQVIAKLPEGERVTRNKNQLPQIAYVVKDQIYVEEIDVKTLMHMIE